MNKILRSYRFDEHTLDLIDELKVALHLSNNSDVLRKSLTLLKLAVDNQATGGAIVLKNAGCEKEVVL
ncbi:hypothetical protein ACSV5M_19195 [Cellvibrio sp. ARAG 10.3]|uniref:hypothetical protein n=1 Tax=Cellvibrio sp. ARAG 10.3 TaxID=3451358 RepID=UPI003F47B39D